MEFASDFNDKEHTFLEKKRDAKEMLQLCIYDYMIKRDLHETAKIFAENINVEMTKFADYGEDLLEDWWKIFWPRYSSRMTNQPGGNPLSSTQPPETMFQTPPGYSQRRADKHPMVADTGILEKKRDVEEMLQFYIYDYMVKRGLYKTAITFAENVNIEILELAGYRVNLLEDWWVVFWPQYSSRMTNQPGGNPLPSSTLQPAEAMFQAPPENSQRRADKRPMDTTNTSILGDSVARKKGKGPLGFPPVMLHLAEVTHVPHSGNPSYTQMHAPVQPPPQVFGACPPVQLVPSYGAGQNLSYSPTAPTAGLTGEIINAADGADPESVKNQVPEAFFELMQQEVEERERRLNPSRA